MAENSAISWCDDTFNPWIGCTKISPACDGCYAEALMGEGGRFARAKWGAPGEGEGTRVRTVRSTWAKPRKWDREQEAFEHNCRLVGDVANPRFVFCASLADVFDNAVPPEWRRDLFDLIRATPHLTWLLLTKRPGNIVKLFADTLPAPADKRDAALRQAWPRNAAIGCTVVNQAEADRDVPKLLAAKAALNPAFAFLSMEPLLGPVNLTHIRVPRLEATCDVLRDRARDGGKGIGRIDWVITGGETDQGTHKARPAHPDWFRSLRDQCAGAGIAYHHKQNGEWVGGAELTAARIPRLTDQPRQAVTWPSGDVCWRIGKELDPCTLDGVTNDARPEIA